MAKNSFTVQKIALIGLLAALVFAACWMQVPVTLPGGSTTRVHLGNCMILLGGLLLGGLPGGLAGGIGAMLFDLTNPLYIASAPFTFTFRFLMGFTCGLIAHRGGKRGLSGTNNIAAALIGTFVYLVLYLTRSFITDRYVQGMALEAVIPRITQKALVSLVNASLGMIVSVPLAAAIRKAAPGNLF